MLYEVITPSALVNSVRLLNTGALSPFVVLVILAAMVAVIWAIIFMERGQRRVPIHYAKRA